MDFPALEKWIHKMGFETESENATTLKLLKADASGNLTHPPFFVQLCDHWVLLSMLPDLGDVEGRGNDFGVRLLAKSRDMRLAKFAFDSSSAVVLCAELPTES